MTDSSNHGPVMTDQQATMERLSPEQVRLTGLAVKKIQALIPHAPGNGAPIGEIEVIAESGWFEAIRD